MFPIPDHLWRCEDCGHEFSTWQAGLEAHLQPQLKCSKCGSFKITGGPVIQGGPFSEDFMDQF